MKLLILLLFLDTIPAILKVNQGNYTKYVSGIVVLTKDCKVVEYLRVKHKRDTIELLHFGRGFNIVDYRLK